MDDPLVMYMADIFTVLASLTGIPAVALLWAIIWVV